MQPKLNLKDRKPVWMALSSFYLDTELQDFDFKTIVATMIESPYSWEELREIDKYELFPVLQPNLLGIPGVWDGFEEAWLVERILKSIAKQNRMRKIGIGLAYAIFKRGNAPYWDSLYDAYQEKKKNF